MHHHHRRRKKRPNYGTRTVEVSRGFNGFGFTISGQAPCILSCIVTNSPADQAGLRAGDFLISVNGMNVSKLPHEAVVQLIGNSLGTIRMQIAEHYFSDSSDEENVVSQINRVRPRYLHHKHKMNRLRNSPQKSRNSPISAGADQAIALHPVIEDAPPSVAHSIIRTPNASTSKDISNVSAMVRNTSDNSQPELMTNENVSLEYRAIVGYLGTIEMPKQIATSSKLQTVRSCIRKMRQEKRNPTTVLMTILPNCLTLKNINATVLATYPSSRLNYVSSSSESENRFFGLVTSAIYASIDDDPVPLDGLGAIPSHNRDVIISNSCHVFVVDTKICDHATHEPRAAEFKISCTKDPISNLCLEFPNNSEYVVNLIRSMYTMKVLPPTVRHAGSSRSNEASGSGRNAPDGFLQANSPQPSNHSEITTASSNSDSGIGFHNDCNNISDRIVVVDFPGLAMIRSNNVNHARPHAICNSIEPDIARKNSIPIVHIKSKSADFNTRLTVRAMPDPKMVVPLTSKKSEIPDLLATFATKAPGTLTATRSCDDVITTVERSIDYAQPKESRRQLQMSIDDITLLTGNGSGRLTDDDYAFLQPDMPIKKTKQPVFTDDSNLMSYKLSPKVFGVNRPSSMSFENLPRNVGREDDGETVETFEVWGSLQELRNAEALESPNFLDGTYSEPEFTSRAFPANGSSPFRRWGQSSFRSARIPETRTPLARRPSSLAASENDVYSKSIDDYNGHDSDSHRSQSEEIAAESSSERNAQEHCGVVSWGQSFEKLLDDPAGLHTFAQFLKKEFSAENIYFWTACERYRQIASDEDRATVAMDIMSKHLANGALEPVNVDSQARNIAEEYLKAADRNLFLTAQKQIFNLMKFDSYQRFIRSDLYKKCIEAEAKNQPLPYPADQLDELLITNLSNVSGHTKLKKSASNAEDRRRKSILPWHRKARCKSRDRADSESQSNSKANSGYKSSSGNTLKPYSTNSTNDIHSSRSSLSSFDAATAFAMGSDDLKTSLCRVILCNGATTIVQTRPNETIRQLVERLLEKRGIQYKFFDVLLSGGVGKPMELELPSTELAGKEVEIEQRVAFKLDLPDPKVISVKSKPKKALGDVLKPILQKYNYRIDEVQVLLRETHEPLTMDLPVTVADGLRLQVVLLNLDGRQQNHPQHPQNKRPSQASTYQNSSKLQLPQVLPYPSNVGRPAKQQVTLDEITNKVFNELLQGKANAHSSQQQQQETKTFDQHSERSDDCASETSSIFDRLRRRESSSAGIKMVRPKKILFPTKTSTAGSEDGLSTNTQTTSSSDPNAFGIKKPLIAKWKTGVKLQVTAHRNEKHEEFLEGLKRAQRARLEDQRGTEINSELPDFLKNKENLNAIKLRKTNQPSSEEKDSSTRLSEPVPSARNSLDSVPGGLPSLADRPQPAPRYSITKSNTCVSIFPPKSIEMHSRLRIDPMNTSVTSMNSTNSSAITNGNSISPTRSTASNDSSFYGDTTESKAPPPPLPPKPKNLPMKSSNWGQSPQSANSSPNKIQLLDSSSVTAVARRHLNMDHQHSNNSHNVYLDQPTSSFV